MLDGKWDADDGNETGDGGEDVSEGEPDASEEKPDDVPHNAKCARADVFILMEGFTADGLFAEGEEGKLPDDKTRFRPRYTHDAHQCDESKKPPAKPHKHATQDKPQKVSDTSHTSPYLFPISY